MPSRARASFSSSFSLPPSRQWPGTRHVVEDHLAGVRGPDAHLLELLTGREPGRPGRDDEAGLAPRPETRVDRGHHHVHVGDPAVGDPGLGAVDDPLVLGLVVDGPGAQRAHVGAGVGLGHGEGGQLDLVRRPEALRAPLHQLLGRAVGGDPGQTQGSCRRWPGRCRRRPRPAPRWRSAASRPLGSRNALGDEVERVEADPGRLLDDRPRASPPARPTRGPTGRMTSSAKSWTHFWIWSWSSLSSSEKSDMASPSSGPGPDPGHRSRSASGGGRGPGHPGRLTTDHSLLLNGNLLPGPWTTTARRGFRAGRRTREFSPRRPRRGRRTPRGCCSPAARRPWVSARRPAGHRPSGPVTGW